MNHLKFTDEMKRVMETWGQNAFGPERIKRIYSFVKDLPEKALAEIVDSLIDNSKYAPTPTMFNDAAAAWKRDNGIYSKYEVPPAIIECEDCGDTGWMFINYKPQDSVILMFCHCPSGENTILNNAGSIIPRWIKYQFEELGMTKTKFPTLAFIPGNEIEKTDLIRRFKQKIIDSSDYWKQQINPKKEA